MKTIRTPINVVDEYLKLVESQKTAVNKKRKEIERQIENIRDQYVNVEFDKLKVSNYNQKLKKIDELQEQYKKELDAELTKLKIEYQKEREKLNKFITNLEQFMTRTNNSNNFKLIESQLKDLNDKYNNDMSNLKLLNTKLEFEKLNLSKKIQQLSNTVNLLNSSKIKGFDSSIIYFNLSR